MNQNLSRNTILLNIQMAGMVIGGIDRRMYTVAFALLATWRSAETFGRDLDFIE